MLVARSSLASTDCSATASVVSLAEVMRQVDQSVTAALTIASANGCCVVQE
jgi:hypothetical protein